MDREAFAKLLPEMASKELIRWTENTQTAETGKTAYTVYRC